MNKYKRCDSRLLEAPLMESIEMNLEMPQESKRDINSSLVNIHDIPDVGTRFFDRNNDEISNISNKEPLVDVNYMGSTNFSQLKKATLHVETNHNLLTTLPPSPTLPPSTSMKKTANLPPIIKKSTK